MRDALSLCNTTIMIMQIMQAVIISQSNYTMTRRRDRALRLKRRMNIIFTPIILISFGIVAVAFVKGRSNNTADNLDYESGEDTLKIPNNSTAMPSVSFAPTSSPPTVSSQPATVPSISVSPTVTCYWIDMTIIYDDDPQETMVA